MTTDACPNCERCTWNPGDDCGRADHPHCEKCGHCRGRHRREPIHAEALRALKRGELSPPTRSTTVRPESTWEQRMPGDPI